MVQLVCDCLNVGIHCKESQLISNSLTTSATDGVDNSHVDPRDDHFFKETSVMTLALAGITMEHDYLCWTRIVGQWAINHCAVCRTDTHAMNTSNDNQRKILVNIRLESNASRIESLRSSANYSPVFRVILPVKFDNQLLESNCAPVLTSQSSVDTKKRSLQQRVQRFLSEEQKLMEERIRTFTEQEHNRFAGMQLQIGRNEDILYHIIDQIGSKYNTDSTLTLPSDQSLAFSSKQLKIVDKVEPELDFDSYSALNCSQNNSNVKLVDNKQKKSQPVRYRSQSVDYESVGGIFDIDVDDGNAFDSISYSDEEDDDSMAFRNTTNEYNNYNSGRNGRTVPTVPNAQMNAQTNGHMAYSLPIQVQVPKWRPFINRKDDIDEDEVPMILNGETIAESIKKLAKSVRNESDIFGDRPRRRLNTGDLIKSRPI